MEIAINLINKSNINSMESISEKELIEKIEDFYIRFSEKYRPNDEIKKDIDILLNRIESLDFNKYDDLVILRCYLNALKLRQDGKFHEAIETYKESLGEVPKNNNKYHSLLLIGIGNCYRELKEFETAIESYREAIKIIEPNLKSKGIEENNFLDILYIFSNNELGNICRFLKNNPDVIKSNSQRKKDNSNNPDFNKEAEDHYQLAIKQLDNIGESFSKTIPFPYHGLGFLYYNTEDFDDAKENWDKAKERFKQRQEKYKEWEVDECLKKNEKMNIVKKELRKNPNCPEYKILNETKEIESKTEPIKRKIALFLEINKAGEEIHKENIR